VTPWIGSTYGVVAQHVFVVERRPVVLVGEKLRRLLERTQRCDVVEHPREDHLAREQYRLIRRRRRHRIEVRPLRLHRAPRCPLGGGALAVCVYRAACVSARLRRVERSREGVRVTAERVQRKRRKVVLQEQRTDGLMQDGVDGVGVDAHHVLVLPQEAV
jgi:hypothetical protein